MSQRNVQQTQRAFQSLVIPLMMGTALYLCVGLLIDREVISNDLVLRYLTGHPISKFTTFMFCIGVASLLVIANNVFDQFCNCDKIQLEKLATIESGSIVNEQGSRDLSLGLLDDLQKYKRSLKSHYIWQRLQGAVDFIYRSGSSTQLDDELKYLAEVDVERQQRRYSLVRIVIWATPMLGFLGTVLGISEALGGIQVGPENDFQGMLNSLRGSLYVAFDTTALALTLSMLLMFLLFFVDRFEVQLLDAVAFRTREELLPFLKNDEFSDPQSRTVEKIGRSVLATSHNLVKQQAEQWQKSMSSADAMWQTSVKSIGEQVQRNLSESLRLANVELADSISRAIDDADDSMAKRWEQWQVLLSENARQLNESQNQLLEL
ncbi:MAG: MotA/TolQ/ExbB proton channel family protein, partial [Planctomycetota bacterium]